MLSALSVAEFCLKDAARLAAMRRLRASCRWRSWRSRERSRVMPPRALDGRLVRGGGHFCSLGHKEHLDKLNLVTVEKSKCYNLNQQKRQIKPEQMTKHEIFTVKASWEQGEFVWTLQKRQSRRSASVSLPELSSMKPGMCQLAAGGKWALPDKSGAEWRQLPNSPEESLQLPPDSPLNTFRPFPTPCQVSDLDFSFQTHFSSVVLMFI